MRLIEENIYNNNVFSRLQKDLELVNVWMSIIIYRHTEISSRVPERYLPDIRWQNEETVIGRSERSTYKNGGPVALFYFESERASE